MNSLKKNTSKKPLPSSERVAQKINHKRKKKKNSLVLFGFLAILFIAVLIWIGLSPICNVRSIVTDGVAEKKAEKIIKDANLLVGQNAFKQAGDNIIDCMFLRFENHEANILTQNPNIESVDIKYNFLGKVTIHVVERSPFVVLKGTVNKKRVRVLVDDKFYVYENKSSKKWNQYLEVEGFEILSTQLSSMAIEEDVLKVNTLKVFIETLQDEMIAQKKIVKNIKKIKISDEKNIEFHINNVKVILGDFNSLSITEKRYKFEFLTAVMKEIKSDEKGTLNLSIGKDAVFKPSKK